MTGCADPAYAAWTFCLGVLVGHQLKLAAVTRREHEARYCCPWGLCGAKLSHAPLMTRSAGDMGSRLFVAERCEACQRPVIWNPGEDRYVRWAGGVKESEAEP